MLVIGLLLAALLDPVFILPALAIAALVRSPWTVFWLICIVAVAGTALLAFLQAGPTLPLLGYALAPRIVIGAVIAYVAGAIRKPSTPRHT